MAQPRARRRYPSGVASHSGGGWSWVGNAITGVVGIAGITGAVYTAARGRVHTEYLAWVARHQDRIADAYTSVLEVAERSNQWAAMVVRPVQRPDDPLPEVPSFDVQGRANALLRAYGSPVVRERFEQWLNAWHALAALYNTIQAAQRDQREGRDVGIPIFPLFLQLQDERWPTLRQRYDELAGTISQELARPPSRRPWWKFWARAADS